MAKKSKQKTVHTVNQKPNPFLQIITTDWPKVYTFGRKQQYGPLSRLAMLAECEGLACVAQGSKANVVGINNPQTGKRIVTPYMNKGGDSVYLCLNGIGTRTRTPQLPDDIKAFCQANGWSFKNDGNYHSLMVDLKSLKVEQFRQLLELIPNTDRQPSVQNTRPTK